MYNLAYLSVATLAVITFVAPSPIREPPLQRRQGVNCTDPNAITSGTCWDGLHLAQYLVKWNDNRPICNTIDGTLEDGSNCCAPNEIWSTCFIRLSIGNHGYNCININEGTCPNFEVDASTSPEVRYVLGTMYSESSLDFFVIPVSILIQRTRHKQLLQQLEWGATLRNALRPTHQPAPDPRDRSHPKDQPPPQRYPLRPYSRPLVSWRTRALRLGWNRRQYTREGVTRSSLRCASYMAKRIRRLPIRAARQPRQLPFPNRPELHRPNHPRSLHHHERRPLF